MDLGPIPHQEQRVAEVASELLQKLQYRGHIAVRMQGLFALVFVNS
jgi:hypothetical protein